MRALIEGIIERVASAAAARAGCAASVFLEVLAAVASRERMLAEIGARNTSSARCNAPGRCLYPWHGGEVRCVPVHTSASTNIKMLESGRTARGPVLFYHLISRQGR
jgi:hypothetical protein